MPTYEVEAGGVTFEVDAPNIKQAIPAARLFAARQRMMTDVTAGAEARSQAKAPGQPFRESLARMGSFGPAPTQEDIQAGREAGIPQLTLAAMAAPATLSNPVALAKGLGMGIAGTAAGGMAGRTLGSGLEAAGAPAGTSQVAGTLGGLAGGVVGSVAGPGGLLKLVQAGGGRTGLLANLAERLAGKGGAEAGKEVLTEAVKRKLELEARRVAAREAAVEIARRRLALAESRLAGGTAKTAARTVASESAMAPAAAAATPSGSVVVPATTGIPVPAADPATIVMKLQQQMKTTAGRKVVRELLEQMPKDTASQIRLMLAKGQAHPATVAVRGTIREATKAATAKPGEELARLLGQIQ